MILFNITKCLNLLEENCLEFDLDAYFSWMRKGNVICRLKHWVRARISNRKTTEKKTNEGHRNMIFNFSGFDIFAKQPNKSIINLMLQKWYLKYSNVSVSDKHCFISHVNIWHEKNSIDFGKSWQITANITISVRK